MTEVQNGHASEAHGKKRKGFFSIFRKSSKSDEKHADGREPEHKRFMDSLVDNAEKAVAKEVMHVAEHEATKQIEAKLDNSNNNGNSNGDDNNDPSTTTDPTTAVSDALSEPTNWAKRMVDSAQQKVQSLQQTLAS